MTAYRPAPKQGYLPIVITNTSTLSADDIYVFFTGKYNDPDSGQYVFSLTSNSNPPMGVYTPIYPNNSTFSVNYSYQLSSLPQSVTGVNDYIVYIPFAPSNRFYFSIGSPFYVETDATPNNVANPIYYAFYDPNYSNLYESIEVGFFPEGGSSDPQDIPWTASINTTEVDAFGLPMKIQYNTYDPEDPTAVNILDQPENLPSGFGVGGPTGVTTRDDVLTNVVTTLTNGDKTARTPKVWPRLALPFYSNPYSPSGLVTYLRVLSPKQSLGNAANPPTPGNLTPAHVPAVQPGPTQFFNYNYPAFPPDYLTTNNYGNSKTFANNLLSYYTSGTSLYISTGGMSPTIYQGVTTGTTPNQVITFTGISGPHTGDVSTLSEEDINTFSMYSGSQIMTGGQDADVLGFYLGDAFTVGFVPSTVGTANSGPPPNSAIDITDAVTWEPYYVPLYYIAQYMLTGGPWYDLYAQALHANAVRNQTGGFLNDVGLCYAYDYDDSLGISGTITPTNPTSVTLSPYGSITIGEIDSIVPDPYSDANTYDVTFVFTTGRTLQYSQEGGPYISVTSGQTVSGLTSNRTTPLNIHYTNGQGPTGDHYLTVYLYYQFLQPLVVFNSSTTSIINSTTIVPNSATPTAFTINLSP